MKESSRKDLTVKEKYQDPEFNAGQTLCYEFSKFMKIDLSRPIPEVDELGRFVEEANRKIGKVKIGTDMRYLLQEDTLRKVFFKKGPYNFKGRSTTHTYLAYAFYLIQDNSRLSETEEFSKYRRYEVHWKNYYERYLETKSTKLSIDTPPHFSTWVEKKMEAKELNTVNSQTLLRTENSNRAIQELRFFENDFCALVNDAYWDKFNTSKYRTVVADFIEKGVTSAIPYALANSFLMPFDVDIPLKYTGDNGDGLTSFYDIIFNEESFRQIIKLTSDNRGEGKSFFIWSFIRKYYRDAHICWVKALDKIDFPIFDPDNKRIIVVIDDKLEEINSESSVIEKIYTSLSELYPHSPITFVFVDSYRHLFTNDPLENIRYAPFDLLEIKGFLLDKKNNDEILQGLSRHYSLSLPLRQRKKHDFDSRLSMPLMYRVAGLIGNHSHGTADWKLWTKDPRVASAGISKLYFATAFLSYFDINLPIDYTSAYFLPGKTDWHLTAIYNSENPFRDFILDGSTKDGDYPGRYLTPQNKYTARLYVHMNKAVQKDCVAFFDELISTIRNRKANNAHSYVFRKIYDQPLLDEWKEIKERRKVLDIIGLFNDLIEGNLDRDNQEKVKGEMVHYLQKQGEYTKAVTLLDKLDNQNGSFVKYTRARIEYQRGNIGRSLEILSELDLSPRVVSLRNDCFLWNKSYVVKGINYYLSNIDNREARTYELNNLLNCLRTYSKTNFNEAEEYFSTLWSLVKRFDEDSRKQLSNILYERAHCILIWLKSQARRDKWDKAARLSSLRKQRLQLAKNIIHEGILLSPSNDKFIALEADIFAHEGDLPRAIKTFESINSLSPFNVKTNFVLARFYYLYACSQENNVNLLKLAKVSLKENLRILDEHESGFKRRLPTVALLAKTYWRQGLTHKGFKLLDGFVTDYSLSPLDESLKNLFSLKKFLNTEENYGSIEDVFPTEL